jgi:hypothetical protein
VLARGLAISMECPRWKAEDTRLHYILGPTGGPVLQGFWHVPFMVGMLATDGPPIHGFKTLSVVPSAPSFYEFFHPLIIYIFHVTHDSLLSKGVWFIYNTYINLVGRGTNDRNGLHLESCSQFFIFSMHHRIATVTFPNNHNKHG